MEALRIKRLRSSPSGVRSMTVERQVVALGIASLLSFACSNSVGPLPGSGGSAHSGGTGGSSGTGTGGGLGTGTGGNPGGGGGSCGDVAACGGSLLGTWTVMSSCLKTTGGLDLTLVGASCPAPAVTGSRRVTGTFTAKADRTFTDDTATTGEDQFVLDAACMIISSTPVACDGMGGMIESFGYQKVTCTDRTGGGCTCSATVNQKGGLAWLSDEPPASGNYATQGNTLTIDGNSGASKYDYCVSSGTLTITPKTRNPVLMGTIVLQGSGASGSGGTIGQTGSGGSSSSGGTSGGTGGSGSGGAGVAGTVGSGGKGGGSGSGGLAGRGGANGGASGAAGATGTNGMGPCDIYKSANTPCVAAHSTVRALFGGYTGKLYQVRNTGGMTKDIGPMAPGGVADAAAQDAFCAGSACVFTIIYDQTGKGLDLWYEGPDSKVGGGPGMTPASATKESIKLGGNKVYSAYISQGNAFWADGSKLGMPLGNEPEAIYMVTSGTHTNTTCCFDYGNSETGRAYGGGGTMDALNFSRITAWQTGAGSGPWVLADLEAGLFSSGDKAVKSNPSLPSLTMPFVTGILRNNGTTEYQLRGGDATAGSLTTYYKGKLPGMYMMKKEGAIVLGSGGDCCLTNKNLGEGTFYEGAIVSGSPTDATEAAVQANIVAAGYSK